jgi:hypothetical protein
MRLAADGARAVGRGGGDAVHGQHRARRRGSSRSRASSRARSSRSSSTNERPTGFPWGLQEREHHRAADEEPIHLPEQRRQHVDLAADLGAAQDGDERMLRVLERGAQVVELGFHQETGDGGLHVVRHALGGRVRAMRRAERVVHVALAQSGQCLRESGVVLLFLGVEAQVLEQQDLAVAERGGSGLGGRPHAVVRPRHVLAQQT